MTTLTVLDRLDARSVRTDTGCLLWTGSLNSKGYGLISVAGVARLAHRVTYAEVIGPIPEGHEIDHTCHNVDPTCPGGLACLHRRCREATHLEAVTHRVNVNRMGHGAEQFCKRGHPLTGANVLVKLRGHRKPVRNCRTCRDAQTRQLVPSSDACKAIGVDRSTLSRWVRDGIAIPAMRMPGKNGAFLFTPSEVARLGATP